MGAVVDIEHLHVIVGRIHPLSALADEELDLVINDLGDNREEYALFELEVPDDFTAVYETIDSGLSRLAVTCNKVIASNWAAECQRTLQS